MSFQEWIGAILLFSVLAVALLSFIFGGNGKK
jgi:hypothetical protein